MSTGDGGSLLRCTAVRRESGVISASSSSSSRRERVCAADAAVAGREQGVMSALSFSLHDIARSCCDAVADGAREFGVKSESSPSSHNERGPREAVSAARETGVKSAVSSSSSSITHVSASFPFRGNGDIDCTARAVTSGFDATGESLSSSSRMLTHFRFTGVGAGCGASSPSKSTTTAVDEVPAEDGRDENGKPVVDWPRERTSAATLSANDGSRRSSSSSSVSL